MTGHWCSRCGDRGCRRCQGTPAENPSILEHLPATGPKSVREINRDLRAWFAAYKNGTQS